MTSEIKRLLEAGGVSPGLSDAVAGLLNQYTPEPIETGPEAAQACRLFASYLNTRAERLDFVAEHCPADRVRALCEGLSKRAGYNARLCALAALRPVATGGDPVNPLQPVTFDPEPAPSMASRELARGAELHSEARDLNPVSNAPSPRDIAEIAGPVCCKCGTDESAFFAETDSGAQVCETCYNMGDCDLVDGENPKVKISDLCAIPSNFQRSRAMPKGPEPDQARKPRDPKGGQGAKLSPPPATDPKGPTGAAVDMLAQARALSEA